MAVNKAILIGNLGADPEIRHTASNQAVANLRVATNETWTDRDGKKQERTEWHRVVAFGRLAEQCRDYLSKGRQVYVEGRIQTREWQDKDGATRYTTEIAAHVIEFLGGGGERRSGGYEEPRPEPSRQGLPPSRGGYDNDDVPF